MLARLTTAAFAAIALAMPAFAQERFTVKVTGQGSDVILIPGLGSPASVWDDTVKQLSPKHRVHVLQVKGFAGEPAGPNAEGPVLAPLIADVTAYAVTLDKPAIIGHSLGGLVAIEAAAKAGDEIDRIMVVDASPFYGVVLAGMTATPERVQMAVSPMRDQIEGLDADDFYAANEQSIAGLVKTVSKRAALTEQSAKSSPRVFATAFYEDAIEDARPLLSQITAKAAVLYAFDEAAARGLTAERADQQFATLYTGLKDVKIRRIDDSYHFIMIDQPEVFAKEVEAFLK